MMATRINISMLCLAMALLATGTMANAQTTDEALREEIRKEVREELQKQEEQQQLEAKKAKIRAEELEREQRTLDQKAKAERNAKRHSGWNVSAHFGGNFPLGKMASTNINTGHFATTGFAAVLNNTIMFGKVMGLHIGVGYEHNPVSGFDISKGISDASDVPNDWTMRYYTDPFEQITVRIGPVVRVLGRNVSYQFRPYAGLNVINGGNYAVEVINGNNVLVELIEVKRKSTSAFLFGATNELSIHIKKRSDIVIGIELNLTFRSMFYETTSLTQPTVFGSEDMELIRLAPTIGYRFHL